VRDVAAANLRALEADTPGAFNVASGTPRSVGDMAAALARAVDPALPPEVTGEWRAGDVRHVFASPERAASELGFSAVEDFEAGMREFAEAKLRA
jgi:dTDP-L-rhamnose 4-epimerase